MSTPNEELKKKLDARTAMLERAAKANGGSNPNSNSNSAAQNNPPATTLLTPAAKPAAKPTAPKPNVKPVAAPSSTTSSSLSSSATSSSSASTSSLASSNSVKSLVANFTSSSTSPSASSSSVVTPKSASRSSVTGPSQAPRPDAKKLETQPPQHLLSAQVTEDKPKDAMQNRNRTTTVDSGLGNGAKGTVAKNLVALAKQPGAERLIDPRSSQYQQAAGTVSMIDRITAAQAAGGTLREILMRAGVIRDPRVAENDLLVGLSLLEEDKLAAELRRLEQQTADEATQTLLQAEETQRLQAEQQRQERLQRDEEVARSLQNQPVQAPSQGALARTQVPQAQLPSATAAEVPTRNLEEENIARLLAETGAQAASNQAQLRTAEETQVWGNDSSFASQFQAGDEENLAEDDLQLALRMSRQSTSSAPSSSASTSALSQVSMQSRSSASSSSTASASTPARSQAVARVNQGLAPAGDEIPEDVLRASMQTAVAEEATFNPTIVDQWARFGDRKDRVEAAATSASSRSTFAQAQSGEVDEDLRRALEMSMRPASSALSSSTTSASTFARSQPVARVNQRPAPAGDDIPIEVLMASMQSAVAEQSAFDPTVVEQWARFGDRKRDAEAGILGGNNRPSTSASSSTSSLSSSATPSARPAPAQPVLLSASGSAVAGTTRTVSSSASAGSIQSPTIRRLIPDNAYALLPDKTQELLSGLIKMMSEEQLSQYHQDTLSKLRKKRGNIASPAAAELAKTLGQSPNLCRLIPQPALNKLPQETLELISDLMEGHNTQLGLAGATVEMEGGIDLILDLIRSTLDNKGNNGGNKPQKK